MREVKRGGMGCVYLAEHLTLKCPVALKTILPFQDDERARRLFFREARLCAQVDHPNVIVILDAGEAGGAAYIIMRFVEGKNLFEYLEDQGGPIPWQTVLRVMRLAVRGLAAVHRKGLVHRDIKPSNIMVSNEGRVLLMDFGLVREVTDASQAAHSGVVGTPQFMSPEQIEGNLPDARSDIFSVGATLYFLLTATSPFGRGTPEMILTRIATRQPPRPVHLVNPSVPQEVSLLVSRAMDFDPSRRFQSADELHDSLRTILLHAPSPGSSPAPSAAQDIEPSPSSSMLAPELAPLELISDSLDQSGPWRGRTRWWLLGGIAVLALLCLLLAIWSSSKPATEPVPDLKDMVLIPAGTARVGTTAARVQEFFQTLEGKFDPRLDLRNLEQRESEVIVAKFWMDRYEVTNEEYFRFVHEKAWRPPSTWSNGRPPAGSLQHPVTGVTRDDAMAYANWAKKQLPTLTQWMRAFRGEHDWLFPWGNDFLPDAANVQENNQRLSKALGPVRDTPADYSRRDVFNLVGNASELTRDIRDSDGVRCAVVKGGNAFEPGYERGLADYQSFLPLGESRTNVGFRCVYEPPVTLPR
jgi:serine/threonine-protein kinase